MLFSSHRLLLLSVVSAVSFAVNANAQTVNYPSSYSNTQTYSIPADVVPVPVSPPVIASAPAPSSSASDQSTTIVKTPTRVSMIDESSAYKRKKPSSFSNSDPNNELGVRYWYSDGKVSYDVEDPKLSRLEYEGNNSHAAELFARFGSPNRKFIFKGLVGLGITESGTVDDEDYAGGTKFSDTKSKLTSGNLGYAQADLGYKLGFLGNRYITTSIFAGYGYFRDTMVNNGIECNQAGPGCSGPGAIPVSDSVKTLKNEAEWNMVRVGIETIIRPTDRLTVRLEAAGVPWADFQDEDSHYLRIGVPDPGVNNLLGTGGTPNYVDQGDGYGMQLEAFLNYRATAHWSLGAGLRYWQLWADSTTTYIGNPVFDRGTSYNWDHQRLGALLEAKYLF